MHEHMETVQVVITNHLMDLLLLLDRKVHWLNWDLIFISYFYCYTRPPKQLQIQRSVTVHATWLHGEERVRQSNGLWTAAHSRRIKGSPLLWSLTICLCCCRSEDADKPDMTFDNVHKIPNWSEDVGWDYINTRAWLSDVVLWKWWW